MAATIQYLGHSAFQIVAGEHRILIDPFLTGNPSAEKAGIRAADLSPTHILVTHAHADHLGDAPEMAKRTGAQVICNHEIAEWLGAEHKIENINPGNPGGRVATSFGSVDFTQAVHSSSLDSVSPTLYMGLAAGLVVRTGGIAIYHAGDTALFSDMKLIGELHRPDVAILPVGDRYTMGPAHAAIAAEWIGAKTMIPCHYDTWPPIEVDLSALTPRNVRVKALRPGETLEV